MKEQAMATVQRDASYVVGIDDAISPAKLLDQVKLVQAVMSSVMKENEHYGKIPGCGPKPTLLKPGAEKLCFTFRLDPEFDVEVIPTPHPIQGHREYRIKCTLFSIGSGNRIGSGVGSASTMETKWRFRTGPTESTGKPVPKEYWDTRKTDPEGAQKIIGGRGFAVKKNESGIWEIFTQGEKAENENPADVYNTVLKMAKKRAMVDAVLTCTAASDIFTQDVEELVENEVMVPKREPKDVTPKPAPVAAPQTSDPLNNPEEENMRDELFTICETIASIKSMTVPAVLCSLTAYGRFLGYQKTTDIPLTKKKKDGTEWMYLETTLSKARKAFEGMKEPGSDDDIPFE